MKFCIKCGTEIQEGTLFCIKCGQPYSNKATPIQQAASIQQAEPIQKATPIVNVAMEAQKTNTKLSKMQKVISLAIVTSLLLGVFIYKVGESLTSREKVVSKFSQAIASKDSAELAKYIVSSDPKLKIDAKNIEPFLSYLDKNPSYRNEIVKSIDSQSTNMAFLNKLNGKPYLFTLKKQGKTWVLYDKYVFELKPVYIKVFTNYKDTKIFLDNNLVCTADKSDFTKEVGPYLPGLYKMRAFLEGDYVKLEETVDVDLVSNIDSSNPNQNIINQKLYLNGYEVSVNSDYEDAKLFSNGKDTGLAIVDAKKFGPISKDGSVRLYAQKDFPWGTIKSEEVAADGSSNIYLKLNIVNENVKNILMETVNSHNNNSVDAFKNRDISKLVNVSESMKMSINDEIQRAITDKKMFDCGLVKAIFDLDSFNIYQRDNKYYAEVTGIESYSSAWYNEGSPVPKTILKEQDFKYILVFDEKLKKWVLEDTSKYNTFIMSSEGDQEVTEVDNFNQRQFSMIGNINGNLPVHMKLYFNKNEVSGTYYYDSHKTEINLKGVYDRANNITIKEFEKNGNNTGVFNGKIYSSGEFIGIWSNIEGTKQFPFAINSTN